MSLSLADQLKKLRDATPATVHVAASLLEPAVVRPRPQGEKPAYARDLRVPYNLGTAFVAATDLMQIGTPVAALALHGFLPPGTMGLAVPAEGVQHLISYLENAPTDNSQWDTEAYDGGQVVISLPEQALVLYPGHVMPLGGVSREGAYVMVFRGTFGHATTAPFGPAPEAYVRVYQGDDRLPHRVGYHPIPAWTRAQPGTDAPNAIAFGGGATVRLYGATHVRLVFQDNVTTRTDIVGAETGTYEVWWMDASGVWAHHEDDDCDAAGRGAILAAHNAETYSVHPGAVAMCVRRVSGDTFFCNVSAFDAQGAYVR